MNVFDCYDRKKRLKRSGEVEIKQLITFVEVAESLHITRTAKKLSFAQSSVTAHIKALEAYVGTALFERLGKKIYLTDAGRTFKHYADQMIALDEEVKAKINGTGSAVAKLTVGAQESQCTYRLTPILKAFKQQYPDVELVFKPAHSHKMAREKLLEGALDFAFITDTAATGSSLVVEKLIKEDVVLVASPEHAIFKRTSLPTPADLKEETFLLAEAGCSYRDYLVKWFERADQFIFHKIEFGSIETIKQCVLTGLGIAILPKMAIEKEQSEGMLKIVQWDPPDDTIYTHIAWHKDKQLTRPLQTFIELTRHHFQSA